MPDLRPCCQQVLLDHYPLCDARREDPRLSALCATCGHVEVLHAIRGNGSRGACSISTGAKAVPCGCKSFAVAPAVQDATDAELLADDPGVGKTSTEAVSEGIDLKSAWAASADTTQTRTELTR